MLAADPALLEQLHPDKLLPSSDAVPERFELGTLPYELLAGTTAAVDFIAGLTDRPGSRRERIVAALADVEAHEDGLRAQIEKTLRTCPASPCIRGPHGARRRCWSPSPAATRARRTARLPSAGSTRRPAPSTPTSPRSGSGSGRPAACGSGWRPYTDDSDVERLLDGLTAFAA